ncbi:MAG TPA: hypothetical protein VD963_08300 [Phycisphaerales bacterium]|nr:hypothetical protein [Phycisphaerales bacterium]
MTYSASSRNTAARTSSLALLAGLGVALTATTALAQAVSFTEGDWSSQWSSAEVMDTTFGGQANFVLSVPAVGGNPGQFRAVTQTLLGSGALVVAHTRNGATYTPSSQGSINSLHVSFDIILLSSTPGPGTNYGLLIQQGGATYLQTSASLANNTGWTHVDLTLVPGQFTKIAGSGPNQPNFTSTGGTIQFGYYTANSSMGSQITRQSGIDNWHVDVNGVSNPPPLCPCDWNNDGNVTTADITSFMSTWFQQVGGGPGTADFNQNGSVNTSDVTAFLSSWFQQVTTC